MDRLEVDYAVLVLRLCDICSLPDKKDLTSYFYLCTVELHRSCFCVGNMDRLEVDYAVLVLRLCDICSLPDKKDLTSYFYLCTVELHRSCFCVDIDRIYFIGSRKAIHPYSIKRSRLYSAE